MNQPRQLIAAVIYDSMPPEERPAMQTVDAVELWADLLRHRLPVPPEVKTAATLQANEGTPEGNVAILEEYEGRLRMAVAKKNTRK